jgi:hypothetical protein
MVQTRRVLLCHVCTIIHCTINRRLFVMRFSIRYVSGVATTVDEDGELIVNEFHHHMHDINEYEYWNHVRRAMLCSICSYNKNIINEPADIRPLKICMATTEPPPRYHMYHKKCPLLLSTLLCLSLIKHNLTFTTSILESITIYSSKIKVVDPLCDPRFRASFRTLLLRL